MALKQTVLKNISSDPKRLIYGVSQYKEDSLTSMVTHIRYSFQSIQTMMGLTLANQHMNIYGRLQIPN